MKVVEVSGVPGLNGPDYVTHAPLRVTCSTRHNNPNVGNHSGPLSLDIGVTAPVAGDLDVEHLPVYTFQQKGTGRSIKVTDPGRGLITGNFADLGKTKVPGLRDLKARAPYFHNGSARDLEAVSRSMSRGSDFDSSRKSGSTDCVPERAMSGAAIPAQQT